MKISLVISLFLPAFAAVTTQGAVILSSGSVAPTVGASDQASLNDLAIVPGGSFNSQAYSDNAGPPGQTFTTGDSASYTLNSFSFKGASVGSANYGGFSASTTWGIRISSVSGTTLTPIATVTGIAHPASIVNGDEWLTWSFSGADALVLSGSTTYSFEAYSTEGWFGFDASDTNTAYAGGTAFNSTSAARAFGANTLQDRLYDRTFVAKMTAVPEPGTSVLILGLAGAGMVRPRRRIG